MARGARIEFKPITPKIREAESLFRAALVPVFDDVSDNVEKDYRRVSDHFHHARPRYQRRRSFLNQIPPGDDEPGWFMATWTQNDPIFYYLDVGAERHRHMSWDWQSLTRPGKGIKTFQRAGVPGRFGPARPIEPRDFTGDVARRNQKEFQLAVFRALIRSAELAWFK